MKKIIALSILCATSQILIGAAMELSPTTSDVTIKEEYVLEGANPVTHASFSPRGKFVVLNNHDYFASYYPNYDIDEMPVISLHDAKTGEKIGWKAPLDNHTLAARIRWSPQETYLFINIFKLWGGQHSWCVVDTKKNAALYCLAYSVRGCQRLPQIATSHDEQRLFFAENEKPIQICDAKTGHVLQTMGNLHASFIIHPRDSMIAVQEKRGVVVSKKRGVAVYDCENGRELKWIPNAKLISFNSDGTRLATGSPSTENNVLVQIFDTNTFSEQLSSVIPDNGFTSQEFDSANRRLLLYGYKHYYRGRLTGILDLMRKNYVSYTTENEYLSADRQSNFVLRSRSCDDHTQITWEDLEGKVIQKYLIPPHYDQTGQLFSANISADNKYAIIRPRVNTCAPLLLDLQKGGYQPLPYLPTDHNKPIWYCFSPNGEQLMIQRWRDKLRVTLCALIQKEKTPEQCLLVNN